MWVKLDTKEDEKNERKKTKKKELTSAPALSQLILANFLPAAGSEVGSSPSMNWRGWPSSKSKRALEAAGRPRTPEVFFFFEFFSFLEFFFQVFFVVVVVVERVSKRRTLSVSLSPASPFLLLHSFAPPTAKKNNKNSTTTTHRTSRRGTSPGRRRCGCTAPPWRS